MIYVNLRGGNDGVGVAGDSLVAALEALHPIHRLSKDRCPPQPLPGPLLERIYKFERTYTAARYIAYCAFEDDLQMRRVGFKARDLFDVVVAVSSWGERALREAGLSAVTTIHQGVDTTCFNPDRAVRQSADDRFVIFSGGKLELRKGQDIVLKAFRAFSERHADARLVASWQQPWTSHAATMAASPHVPFSYRSSEPAPQALQRWIADAGIDPDRVELVRPMPHAEMVSVYAGTDVGLFPSRCEGGTNLVMMEYMACGRPVVSTDFGGHQDILTPTNSLRLQNLRLSIVSRFQAPSACWCEPDVEEVVESLHMLYRDRHRMKHIGETAARDLTDWTWARAARRYVDLLVG